MKKFAKVLAVVLTLVMAMTCFAGCGEKAPDGKELKTVRMGIHSNISGAVLVAVAEDMGYFEEEGIKAEITIVESGPTEMAAMRAGTRTLDVGYIGAGVAWNALDAAGNGLSFVYFNGLGDAEGMVARKGVFTDTNSNGKYDFDELYAGMIGKTVYLDTATTPAGWFKTLVNYINEGKSEADALYIASETSDFIKDYAYAATKSSANVVEVVHTANTNIASVMSTTSSSKADITVSFAPIPEAILAANSDVELVAKTSTHFATKDSSIESFVASDAWIAEDPETVQGFVNALTKAAAKRKEDVAYATKVSEELCNVSAGTYDAGVAWWPTMDEYKDMFSSSDKLGYEYMEALYDMAKPNVSSGEVEAFEDTMDFSFMLKSFE